MTTPIVWKGEQSFRVVGTSLHEDTLRVRSNYEKAEAAFRLRLPTLSITYADLKFINAIGGVQARWPDSAVYGPKFFDPPVEINGLDEVERLTWIRGAHRVVIGPGETEIHWFSFRELVIPRLRIGEKDPLEATLVVDHATVHVEPELCIDISQYANGRQIGGVSVVKRHPEWREPRPEKPLYRLWVRAVDFDTGRPMIEAKLAFFRWEEGATAPHGGRGAFVPVEEAWTDGAGWVVLDPRPATSLEAVTLAMDGWRATPKVWRSQDGQTVSLLLPAARLKETRYPGRIRGATRGIYAGAYNLDPGDTLEWMAAAFCYKDVAELADMNGVAVLEPGRPVPLPGWCFLHAQSGVTLADIARTFRLDKGWPRTTGRHHRPDPQVPLEHEIVAIPTPDFAASRAPA